MPFLPSVNFKFSYFGNKTVQEETKPRPAQHLEKVKVIKCSDTSGFGFLRLPVTSEPKMSSRICHRWCSPIDSLAACAKDRCVSTCQVKANKSIALYQASWYTAPCLLSSQAFTSPGPQKEGCINQTSTKNTYQTLAVRTSRPPTRWQLKCALGL